MKTAFVLAAGRSGEGKTTISLGIMAALRRRGLRVQGFKVGPDYLDTSYQRFATGLPGRNLDLWMMGEPSCRNLFLRTHQLVDVSVVEGVMGLFDGHRDDVVPTSTAAVARLLGVPIVLVLDAKSCGASLAAIAYGFVNFERDLNVVGVILNRWREGRSRVAVEKAFASAGIPILGFVPPDAKLELPSRHLGLYSAEELGETTDRFLSCAAERIETSVDLNRLLSLGGFDNSVGKNGAVNEETAFLSPNCSSSKVRLGVAQDAAFSFYYEDGLEFLRRKGVEIVPFSPIAGRSIPDVDGLYFGGGYPENHLSELSTNTGMRESIERASACGMPIYAECGGLLYLARGVATDKGEFWPLVGLVPAEAVMRGTLQRMGYRQAKLMHDCLLGSAGYVVRGHEFHYSTLRYCEVGGAAYCIDAESEGYSQGNVFASYLHLHFCGCEPAVDSWIEKMRSFKKRGQNVEK